MDFKDFYLETKHEDFLIEVDGEFYNSVDINLVGLTETIKRTWVIRNNKRVLKFKTNREGYRVQMIDGRPREVRMTAQEKIKRKRAQRIASRKRKAKRAVINRKVQRSKRKRTSMNLKDFKA